jgi:cytochrome c5
MRLARAVLLALALMAGCGGGEEAERAAPAATTTAPTTETQALDKVDVLGQNVFLSRGCGFCHSLSAAHSEGNGKGPNLDELTEQAARASRGTLEEFVRESIARPSAYTEPGFEKGLMAQAASVQELTAEDVEILVRFLVASAEQR